MKAKKEVSFRLRMTPALRTRLDAAAERYEKSASAVMTEALLECLESREA